MRAISGSVAVLSTDEKSCLDIDRISGQPLLVSHEAGILTVSYEDLQPGTGCAAGSARSGIRPPSRSPCRRTARSQLGVVNASAIVSGISAKISAKSVSGDITLDGVTGSVDAKTVSGDVEARGLGGDRRSTRSPAT